MSELVEIRNLSKYYPMVRALDNVNLSLKKGRIIGLLGPNGSGKTSLIKILVGLTKSYVGDVKIDGMSIGENTKGIVAYLPDHDFLSERFTVNGALDYYNEFFPDFNIQKALTLLDKFKINTKYKVKSLSKGNREKLQLILTISREAQLYIFDEPIAGVDPASREVIFELIMNNYKAGSTVLISTHLISDAESIFDEIIFLKNGCVAVHEEKQVLIDKYGKSIDALFREVFRC